MLFGHQDDANRPSAPATAPNVDAPTASNGTGVNPLAVDPATGVSLPVAPPEDTMPASDNPLDEPSVLDQPSVVNTPSQTSFAGDPAPTTPFGSSQAAAPSDDAVVHPNAAPVANSPVMPAPVPTTPPSDPVAAAPADPAPSFSDYAATSPSNDNPAPGSDDLLDIKQQALSQLGPLVSHLEQSPEEKFRTTMMLIQSTDNSALLKNAYEAAQAIPDEKVRAQALLDVVNEINYFTQQQSDNSDS